MHYASGIKRMTNCIPICALCNLGQLHTRQLTGSAEFCITGCIKRDYCVRCQERWVPPVLSPLPWAFDSTNQSTGLKGSCLNKILLNLSWLNFSFWILRKWVFLQSVVTEGCGHWMRRVKTMNWHSEDIWGSRKHSGSEYVALSQTVQAHIPAPPISWIIPAVREGNLSPPPFLK